MRPEQKNKPLKETIERPFSETWQLNPRNGIIVNSEFVLATHNSIKGNAVRPASLGIFAPARVNIQREKAKNKRGKHLNRDNNEIQFLNITFLGDDKTVFIDKIEVKVFNRNMWTLLIKISSPTPLKIEQVFPDKQMTKLIAAEFLQQSRSNTLKKGD